MAYNPGPHDPQVSTVQSRRCLAGTGGKSMDYRLGVRGRPASRTQPYGTFAADVTWSKSGMSLASLTAGSFLPVRSVCYMNIHQVLGGSWSRCRLAFSAQPGKPRCVYCTGSRLFSTSGGRCRLVPLLPRLAAMRLLHRLFFFLLFPLLIRLTSGPTATTANLSRLGHLTWRLSRDKLGLTTPSPLRPLTGLPALMVSIPTPTLRRAGRPATPSRYPPYHPPVVLYR